MGMKEYCLWCNEELDWFSLALIDLETKEEYIFCSGKCANNWCVNKIKKEEVENVL